MSITNRAQQALSVIACLGLVLLAGTARAYSVAVTTSPLQPSAVSINQDGSASEQLTGPLNTNDTGDENQISNESWSWVYSMTYSSTKNGPFGPLPANPPTVSIGGGSSTSLTMSTTHTTPTTPGYYSITVTATVSFTTPPDGNGQTNHSVSSPATDAGTLTAVLLNLTGPSGVQVIGEGALFNGSAAPSDVTISGVNWSAPQDVVGAFVVSNDGSSGHKIDPLMTTDQKPQLKFYWVKDGQQTVALSASIAGAQCSLAKNFIVEKPDVSINTSTGQIGVDTQYAAASFNEGNRDISPNSVCLHDGTPTVLTGPPVSDLSGIIFRVTVDDPAGFTGKPTWIQLIDSSSYAVTTNQGTAYHNHRNSGIDGEYPYEWLFENGNLHYTHDSPGFQISNPSPVAGDNNPITEADTDQSYSDWLMYKPATDDSIPVPVKKLTWGWHGKAVYDSVQGWQVDPSSSNPNPGSGSDTTQFPYWTSFASDVSTWTQ